MKRALTAGVRATWRCLPLVLILWLIAAACGGAFALAAGAWLGEALEGSLATRSLRWDLDANVLVDLWYHHREGLRMLAVAGAVVAAVHTALWWWLDAVVILSLPRSNADRPADAPSAWTRGIERAPTMAYLWAMALAILAVFTAGAGSAAYEILRWTRNAPSPFVWDAIIAGAVVLWAIGAVFLVAVHDHARIRTCRTGAGAFAAYRWALQFVIRGKEGAFPLACALQFTGVLLAAAYFGAGRAVPVPEVVGPAVSLVLGEAFLLARMWLRVWFYAAQGELQ